MIRTRLEVNPQPLLNFTQFLKDFDDVVGIVFGETFDVIQPRLLDELQYEPGKPKRPFVWSDNPEANARARRAFFYLIASGQIQTDGSHYVRTGNLKKSWRVTLERDGKVYRMSVSNNAESRTSLGTSRYAPFVVGSFQPGRAGSRRQLPGHRRTGWPLSAKTVDFWFDAFSEEFDKQFDKVIPDDLGTYKIRGRGQR